MVGWQPPEKTTATISLYGKPKCDLSTILKDQKTFAYASNVQYVVSLVYYGGPILTWFPSHAAAIIEAKPYRAKVKAENYLHSSWPCYY